MTGKMHDLYRKGDKVILLNTDEVKRYHVDPSEIGKEFEVIYARNYRSSILQNNIGNFANKSNVMISCLCVDGPRQIYITNKSVIKANAIIVNILKKIFSTKQETIDEDKGGEHNEDKDSNKK